MVENAAKTERHNTVTGTAVDVCRSCVRMACHLPQGWSAAIGNMAGITAVAHNIRPGVVGVGIQETGSGMTVTALRSGLRMNALGWRRCLPYSHGAVVAA